MDEHRKRIRRFLYYLKAQSEDRGMMADLRHGFSPGTEYRAWPHIAAWCDLTHPREKVAWVTIGAAFASLKGDQSNAGNLGATLRRIALDGASGSPQDVLKSFDARFRRLLTCSDTKEVCERLPGIVRAAERKGIGVNLEELYCDLVYWHERVKLRWASAYWGARSENADERAGEGT
jgi:CRISPR system Cascade subunit CasB